MHAVRTRTTPLVDGVTAVRAMEVAERIRAALETRMSAPLRVLLVAGEASGDLHGAALVGALRQRVPDIEVAGVGGPRLRAAGMRVLVDTEHVATMGFVETFGTLGRLLRTYRRLVRFLDERAAAPGRSSSTIPSSTCASPARPSGAASRSSTSSPRRCGPGGAAACARSPSASTSSASSFRSRPSSTTTAAQLAEFIGHPLLDVVRADAPAGRDARRATASTPTARVLALLPGSRKKEVRYLLRADVRGRDARWPARAGSRSSRWPNR